MQQQKIWMTLMANTVCLVATTAIQGHVKNNLEIVMNYEKC